MQISVKPSTTPANGEGATKIDNMETPNENNKSQDTNTPVDESLNERYIDKRNIIVSLVHNYSAYRKANMSVLGHRTDIIGSSVNSCRVLSSNKGEVETYFPSIIGLNPNHPDFTTRVKSWLSNIQVRVNENNTTLDVSFVYNKKSDYLKIKAEEDAIDAAYAKIDKTNLTAVKEALRRKITDLNTLESTKYQYGYPVNLEQYLIYRHCLLYNDVAKDVSLINSDPSYRFYIKDEEKEKEKEKKFIVEKKAAVQNFIELCGKDNQFNAVYTQMAISTGNNLQEYNSKSRLDKENILMNFATNNPDKFNRFVRDKHILTKALIETLISRGELVRAEFNQQISTPEGGFIGSNINEAVAYFENPENAAVRTAYENKLKLL